MRVTKHHAATSDLSVIQYNVDILEDIASRQQLKKRHEEYASAPSFTRESQSKDLYGCVNLVI